MARILVCGGGGFIGSHLIKRLKQDGHWVRSADLFYKTFNGTFADEKLTGDLTDIEFCKKILQNIDCVFQLAADMGGAGYIFTGKNDADIMCNSALCNLNILKICAHFSIKKVFFSSSACIYPFFNQKDPNNPICSENTAYPAMPDSEYGWEKLFSERVFLAFNRNHNMNCKIARFHNVYGPNGAWNDGKEKAPAAICRKVAAAEEGSYIELWGDGQQTRSFLFIDDCLDGILALMDSEFTGPVNIGSEEMVTIQKLAEMVISLSGKSLKIKFIPGPTGVRGRRSDNALALKMLNWQPKVTLLNGITKTYNWIQNEMYSPKNT